MFGSARYLQVFGLFGISSWCWILAFFGFALKHLARSTPWLAYANEAVLPFYVMHQTVLLSVGYFVTPWPIPDLLKFVVISSSSFLLIAVVYEFLIRRVNVLRVAFGMKPQAREQVSVQPAFQ
jgi:glucan biosynthesis protein C